MLLAHHVIAVLQPNTFIILQVELIADKTSCNSAPSGCWCIRRTATCTQALSRRGTCTAPEIRYDIYSSAISIHTETRTPIGLGTLVFLSYIYIVSILFLNYIHDK